MRAQAKRCVDSSREPQNFRAKAGPSSSSYRCSLQREAQATVRIAAETSFGASSSMSWPLCTVSILPGLISRGFDAISRERLGGAVCCRPVACVAGKEVNILRGVATG